MEYLKEITVFAYACVVAGALLYVYYLLFPPRYKKENEKLKENIDKLKQE